ncbi:threonine/homoserine exporter RhtA [Affinibrenneria salicis]|uniref:Threonine/homoserine exporter RhtA n=1 Tax=Affinibrenneria salicis TaxID=2590031 RepID=A0A5J5G1J3_9GAMM|nr:threonine/homoserine exporter RhtA [Affinibrenneria salicis]KAA9000616.1 threonine/homoserine exporter RhtA [Affinibrenneria salicis]
MTASSSGRKKNTLLLPILLLLIAMISIQVGAAIAKTLFPLIGAAGVTALRLGLSMLILLAIFQPWKVPICRDNRLALLIYGLTLGGMNFLFYLALRTVPLGVVVALEFTGPLAVAMCSSRRAIDFFWIALAILGLWFLLPLGHNIGNVDLAGALCALGAGTCWAMYILFGQKAGALHGPATVALGSAIAALIFCPAGLLIAGTQIFSLSVLPLGLAVAILSSALPYALEMVALTRLPTRTFSTLMSLEPAIAALSGILFLNEHLSPLQWLALGCVIGASIGATLTIRAAPRADKAA